MIDVILWDCDGVLQHPAHDWNHVLTALSQDDDFVADLFETEKPALRGEEALADGVARVLARHRVDRSVEQVLGLWDRFTPDEDAWRVVDDLRGRGVRCVLATNQQDVRVRIMRERLRYDDRVDAAYYSSEVGAMKPDPEYFERVLAAEGVPAQRALFVDDNAANVRSAASLGLRTVHHDPAAGAGELRSAVEDALLAF